MTINYIFRCQCRAVYYDHKPAVCSICKRSLFGVKSK